jgi:hypothetical protein
MDDIIKVLVSLVSGGGTTAVVGLLIVMIGWLVYDRIQILKDLSKSLQQTLDAKEDEKKIILEIVEKYHTGNMTMAQAINEIKLVLVAIQSRIQ